jgi:hypothetical protein
VCARSDRPTIPNTAPFLPAPPCVELCWNGSTCLQWRFAFAVVRLLRPSLGEVPWSRMLRLRTPHQVAQVVRQRPVGSYVEQWWLWQPLSLASLGCQLRCTERHMENERGMQQSKKGLDRNTVHRTNSQRCMEYAKRTHAQTSSRWRSGQPALQREQSQIPGAARRVEKKVDAGAETACPDSGSACLRRR